MKRGIKTNLKRYRVARRSRSRWTGGHEVLAANPMAAASAFCIEKIKSSESPLLKKTKADWGYVYYHVRYNPTSTFPAARLKVWELD